MMSLDKKVIVTGSSCLYLLNRYGIKARPIAFFIAVSLVFYIFA